MIRLGAVTTAYRDAETIRGTLACLAPFVEKHYVLISEHPFNGHDLPPDNTDEICAEFPNVEVIKGLWPEHVMRNLGVTLCKEFDWMIGFDADEMMTAKDLELLRTHLEYTSYDAVGFVSKVYWHSPFYRFEPYPDHIKVCVVRTNSKVRYLDKQCVNSPCDVLRNNHFPFITHHHLSWSAPKNILRKVIHYNHASEFDGKTWYEKHYKDWKAGDPVLQPFGTKWTAIFDPLPDELMEKLNGKCNKPADVSPEKSVR